jgi:hypothetical protein
MMYMSLVFNGQLTKRDWVSLTINPDPNFERRCTPARLYYLKSNQRHNMRKLTKQQVYLIAYGYKTTIFYIVAYRY